MKSMTCKELGGPCDVVHRGTDADEVIKAQDAHLKQAATSGDAAHAEAAAAMKARWRNPLKGMAWYKATKKTFAELPEN